MSSVKLGQRMYRLSLIREYRIKDGLVDHITELHKANGPRLKHKQKAFATNMVTSVVREIHLLV